ncbi:MAG: xanthine dehydrogenase, partial [Alphaproteobacteria bacterium HGW-Alphaproteobacteria-2]
EGVAEDRLATLAAPAGLDIGAIGPEEIALSILAQVVAARRAALVAGGQD